MKTLHRYLLRQVIASLLMTVAVFTFVLLLGNVLKDVLPLLMNGQAAFDTFAEAVGLLIPYVWVFALPMALLTATLLVFGRFSADQELTAARAGGVSLISLVTPILLLSLVLCAVSAVVNMEIAPRARVAFNQLKVRFTAELSGFQLPEGAFIKEIPGVVVYIGAKKNQDLEDVTFYQTGQGTNGGLTVHAPRGRWDVNPANGKVIVRLFDSRGVRFLEEGNQTITGNWESEAFALPGTKRRGDQLSVSDMTFFQLREELKNLEAIMSRPLSTNAARDASAAQKRTKSGRLYDVTSPVHVHMHRQLAFSFACFGFALIGIPLGVRVQRRESNVGYAVAMVLVLVYYGFVLVGLSLSKRPEFAPHLILWLPNLVFQGVGAFLLWRANRGW